MRLISKHLLFACILFSPVLAFPEDLGFVRLSLTEGDIQVQIKDSTDWTDAAVNLPLYEGDRIWAADDGKAELQIRGGVYTRMDGNTALDILTITHDSVQFYVDRGHVYINNRRRGIQTVQVDTPQSSIRSYDNSIMFVDVSEDGAVEVSVLKGYAYAESRAGATRVSAGNTLTLRGEENGDLAPLGSPDEWEQWNIDRDRRMNAWSDSSRYLPDDLHEYSSDFDDNGRWVYVSDYGYVWTPTVVVTGWAPYSVGSWVWIRGNYVWIAYDPWCWAPSHYGRWVYIGSYGWCWIPPTMGAVYWSPGYVGWIVTATYVAWVPLAPGEIYYGYGYYGPWSRNISTVNVNTIVVNRNYANRNVNNGVMVVQRDSFGTGRRIQVNTGENPFDRFKQRIPHDITIVPPRDKPKLPIVIIPNDEREQMRHRLIERERTSRESHLVRPSQQPAEQERPERPGVVTPPVERPTRPQVRPPERFRNIRPEEMKNDRRLVKEREASVFKPQQPDNLPVRKSNKPKVIIRKPTQQLKQNYPSGDGRERRQER